MFDGRSGLCLEISLETCEPDPFMYQLFAYRKLPPVLYRKKLIQN